MPLLLAFVALPLLEIALFVAIGSRIGLGATLLFVVVSFLIGAWVIRTQGDRARDALRRSASGAVDPTEPLAKGAFTVLAGGLLMVPGFFTSAVGALLLIPFVQTTILGRLAQRVSVTGFGFSGTRRTTSQGDDIVEGEYHEITTPTDRLPPRPGPENGSGWTRG